MKRYIVILFLMLFSIRAKADMWGGDLPLLMQIVTNTLNTLMELRAQTTMLEDEMAGIKDRINRVQTIAEVVQPSTWQQWQDPAEALRRLKIIYHTLPKEYRSPKSDAIEDEISRAMAMVSKVSIGANSSFLSGKELERRGADASPGVSQKLTASGIGSLVAMEAQTQVIQSHITSLLAQMLAEGNERESREIVSRGASYSSFSGNLNIRESRFSALVLKLGLNR
jgi:hypothetical protein